MHQNKASSSQQLTESHESSSITQTNPALHTHRVEWHALPFQVLNKGGVSIVLTSLPGSSYSDIHPSAAQAHGQGSDIAPHTGCRRLNYVKNA